MLIKTNNLIGPALDWAVAKAEGAEVETHGNPSELFIEWPHNFMFLSFFRPSTDWSQGGPISERERISARVSTMPGTAWAAFYDVPGEYHAHARQKGPTELVAKMRCLVVFKLGDEVDVPEELL